MAIPAIMFTWIAFGVAVALLALIGIIFVKRYEDEIEHDHFVTIVCIFSLAALLATVCLLPVDIALVSHTVNYKTGLRKDWATPGLMHNLLKTLKIVYYTLYSLDALCCFLLLPFAYFFFEEYDDESSLGSRIVGALKFSAAFVILVAILLLVGFFAPTATSKKAPLDWDYFKRLLSTNRSENMLFFLVGVMLCLGTLLYVLYTAAGLALLPVSLIKSIPPISQAEGQVAAEALERNRERMEALEGRCHGDISELSKKDRREYEMLKREQRRLERREEIAEQDAGHPYLHKFKTISAPFKIAFGFLILIITLLVATAMLITGIDKARSSVCGPKCGYILGSNHIFNPVNWILVQSSKVFPLDYVLMFLLVLMFFFSSIVGLVFIGIRFLWVSLFRMRRGRTTPQALCVGTMVLTLIVIDLNYSFTMMIAPQYAHYGGQTYCNHTLNDTGPILLRDCSKYPELIFACSESAPQDVCTATIASTFINRITLTRPFFGVFLFWAQFVFLAVFFIALVTSLIHMPRFDDQLAMDTDDDLIESEGLLSGTRRRFGAAWDDVRGRRGGTQRTYGAAQNGNGAPASTEDAS